MDLLEMKDHLVSLIWRNPDVGAPTFGSAERAGRVVASVSKTDYPNTTIMRQ